MVQLKRDLLNPKYSTANNKYWSIGGEAWDVQWEEQRFRKKKHINLISGPVTARIVTDRANRKERGLLNYENCSVDELEAFGEEVSRAGQDPCPARRVELFQHGLGPAED